MENNREVLLKVDHLCQYFRLGRKDLKAVDDVSFEIKKGESFGLVGESGCGKTTTGRSIIKLYDITSGNVYFKGQRIGAGTRSYKDAIAAARDDAAKKIKALRAEKDVDDVRKAAIQEEIKQINEELHAVVAKNRALIKDARSDSKEVDKQYVQTLLKALEEEYALKFRNAEGNDEKLKALQKEYRNRCRVAKKSKLITQIQMIFQDPIASLDPRMTVRDIIAEGLVINGITDKAYINEKVYEILETVGLVREHADRYPHEFSGGQRQRIGIARAVIMQPEMIIADEPISALDVSIQAQVINMFEDLQDKMGLTYLFIAHDLLVVRHISDRIAVMYLGRMVELADAKEIYDNPLHPYSKSLLSAVPVPDPKIARENTRIVLEGDIPSPLNAPSCCPFRTRCPYATEQCAQSMPEFKEVQTGHFVACHRVNEIN